MIKYFGFSLSVFFLTSFTYYKGYEQAEMEAEAVYSAYVTEASKVGIALHDYISLMDKKHFKELLDVQENLDSVLSDIDNRGVRVLVRSKVKSCSVLKADSTSPSGMDDGGGTAELDAGVAKRIINLTARGDKAIVQLTACQEYVKGIIK